MIPNQGHPLSGLKMDKLIVTHVRAWLARLWAQKQGQCGPADDDSTTEKATTKKGGGGEGETPSGEANVKAVASIIILQFAITIFTR